MNNPQSEKKHHRGGSGRARLKNGSPGRRFKKATDDFYDVETAHYYDTLEFKDYCDLVLSVIGETPLSIREIKLLLGEKLIEKWLADALDMIEDKLQITHSIPTKYSRK